MNRHRVLGVWGFIVCFVLSVFASKTEFKVTEPSFEQQRAVLDWTLGLSVYEQAYMYVKMTEAVYQELYTDQLFYGMSEKEVEECLDEVLTELENFWSTNSFLARHIGYNATVTAALDVEMTLKERALSRREAEKVLDDYFKDIWIALYKKLSASKVDLIEQQFKKLKFKVSRHV